MTFTRRGLFGLIAGAGVAATTKASGNYHLKEGTVSVGNYEKAASDWHIEFEELTSADLHEAILADADSLLDYEDSIPVKLSDGEYSFDGGETWTSMVTRHDNVADDAVFFFEWSTDRGNVSFFDKVEGKDIRSFEIRHEYRRATLEITMKSLPGLFHPHFRNIELSYLGRDSEPVPLFKGELVGMTEVTAKTITLRFHGKET